MTILLLTNIFYSIENRSTIYTIVWLIINIVTQCRSGTLQTYILRRLLIKKFHQQQYTAEIAPRQKNEILTDSHTWTWLLIGLITHREALVGKTESKFSANPQGWSSHVITCRPTFWLCCKHTNELFTFSEIYKRSN